MVPLVFYVAVAALKNAHCEPAVHLKIGIFDRRPDMYIEKDASGNTTQYYGTSIYSVDWLSQRLNFTYSLIPMGKSFGGKMPDGKWVGAMGSIVKNEIDLVAPPVLLSYSRAQVLDYAGVSTSQDSALISPATLEDRSILKTFRPYTPPIWILIMVSILVVAFTLHLTSRSGSGGFRWKEVFNFTEYILPVLSILTNQGEMTSTESYRYRFPFRIASAAWCLMACVLVNVYNSTLISHLTTRKETPPPQNAFDLPNYGLSYLVLRSGIGPEIILAATSGPLKVLGDELRKHPENLVNDIKSGVQRVATGCCAYTDLEASLQIMMAEDFKETGKCRFSLGNPTSGYGYLGFALPKKSPHAKEININVIRLYETGLPNHWQNEFTRADHSGCFRKPLKVSELRSLNLLDLTGAFLILGIGYVVSFVVFISENCYPRFKKTT